MNNDLYDLIVAITTNEIGEEKFEELFSTAGSLTFSSTEIDGDPYIALHVGDTTFAYSVTITKAPDAVTEKMKEAWDALDET